MKIAVIQLNSSDDKKSNIARALSFVESAIQHQARFIVLPEVFNYRGKINTRKKLQSIAEHLPGKSTAPFLKIARRNKVFILAGSIYEKIGNSNKVYNTSGLIYPSGKVCVRYRKIHLFDALIGKKVVKESALFRAGRKLAFGCVDEFSVGLSICYDLRFPEIYREYARKGAHILCVPSAFTKMTGKTHWEVLLRARAVENLCYVVAANQIGCDARGIEAFGHSLIVNPWGEVIARASADKEEVIFAEISMETLRDKRKIFPSAILNPRILDDAYCDNF